MESLCAGIIIIGDEVLKGQTIDTNSHFLCKRFYDLGVKVCKVVVVADNVEEIALEVSEFSKRYHIVITTGGIGPTHDDVTYEAIAAAFSDEIVLSPEIAKFFQYLSPGSSTDVTSNPGLKEAMIPKSASVIFISSVHLITKANTYPVVRVSNVFIFPGIPQYLECLFTAMEKEHFLNTAIKFHTDEIYLNVDEIKIVMLLNSAAEQFKGTVTFGCYPYEDKPLYKTKITVESKSANELKKACQFLKSQITDSFVVSKDMLFRK